MSDVVRDLVVSLSLDAGEFTRNMRAIQDKTSDQERLVRGLIMATARLKYDSV